MADAKSTEPEQPKPATQLEFARIMGISQPAVHKLVRKGVLKTGHTLGQWLVEYGKHMAEAAAGRQSETGKWNLVDERARLSVSQRERIELENEEKRAKVIPLFIVSDILAQHNSIIRNLILGAANAFKADNPEVTTKQITSLKKIHYDILTQLSHVKFSTDLDDRIKSYFRDLHAPAKSNGNGVGG